MGKKFRKRFRGKEITLEPVAYNWMTVAAGLLLSVVVIALSAKAYADFAGNRSQPRLYSFSIKATYPHDPSAFTQGLEFDKLCVMPNNCTDVFWESTGMNGESEMRLVELETGKVLRSKRLDAKDFGEGVVKIGGRLVQLTWRSSKALSYAIEDLEDVQELRTPLSDGWGVTHTGGNPISELIISDGSATLTVVDSKTLEKKNTIEVKDEGKPVRYLNELEWIKGEVWANVWQTECLARINHKTGHVRGWVLLHGLLHKLRRRNVPQAKPMDVLNGIAWDREKKRLFVTGKYWPALFEIALRPHPGRLRPETIELARKRCIL